MDFKLKSSTLLNFWGCFICLDFPDELFYSDRNCRKKYWLNPSLILFDGKIEICTGFFFFTAPH